MKQFILSRTDRYYAIFDNRFLQAIRSRLHETYPKVEQPRYDDLQYIASVLQNPDSVNWQEYYRIKDCACEVATAMGWVEYGDDNIEIQGCDY